MSLNVIEKVDSPSVSRVVQDGYNEPHMTRKFVITGADDPAQSNVVALTPQQGVGYFTKNSNVLSSALNNATVYTSLPIQGSLIAIASGATMVLGVNGASQTVTTSAPVAIGATTISVSSFTTARAYAAYSPVTPGSTAPTNTLGLYCIEVHDEVKMLASGNQPGVIERSAIYGPAWRLADGNIGAPKWTFDIQTENVHVQTAFDQTDYPSANDDVGLAIGVQSDGTIQGVDKLAPKSLITAIVKQTAFSASYQDQLEAIVGKTNVASFQGYAAGRLLFLGCVAEQKGNGYFECKYVWAKNPASVTTDYVTTDPATLADTTQHVVKAAWQYVWTRNAQVDDGTGDAVTMITLDVHVADIYQSGDYSVINFNQ